jgi:GMP synthase-like glutamine amidotransferase
MSTTSTPTSGSAYSSGSGGTEAAAQDGAARDPAASGGIRVLVVVHEDHAGLGRLEPALRARLGDVVDERRPDLGDPLPADLSGFAGLVVLGGSMAAWEDEVATWLPWTRRLLADGVERGVPTLGICLGAQLLALATGGRVERGTAGLEVGLVPVDLLPEVAGDALLGPVAAAAGPRVGVPQWHQDAITALPAGAVPLATGERYPHQAFRLGPCGWGLQYHPEVTAVDFEDWLVGGHGVVRTAGLDADRIRADLASSEDAQQRVAQAHADGFADAVAARAAAR